MNKKILVFGLAVILVGGLSFFAGFKYCQRKNIRNNQRYGGSLANLSPEDRQARMQQFGGGQKGMRNGLGGAVIGEILSKDEKSLTVKNQDGGSKIVIFSSSTQFMKNTEGSIEDLKVGDNIMVNGSANQDGSVIAQNIQLRPNIHANVGAPQSPKM